MEEMQNSPTESTEEDSWYCRDCEERLTIIYDERDDEETPVVCGSCGGTNTRKIVTDGGRDDAVVLLSIDPDHAEMLLAGLKRYEYRRVAPATEPPYMLYLYATDPVQKVVGKVEVLRTIDGHPTDVIEWTVDDVPSTRGDLEEYFDGTDEAHALEVAYQEDFDGPRLDTLKESSLTPSQNFRYVDAEGLEVLP